MHFGEAVSKYIYSYLRIMCTLCVSFASLFVIVNGETLDEDQEKRSLFTRNNAFAMFSSYVNAVNPRPPVVIVTESLDACCVLGILA